MFCDWRYFGFGRGCGLGSRQSFGRRLLGSRGYRPLRRPAPSTGAAASAKGDNQAQTRTPTKRTSVDHLTGDVRALVEKCPVAGLAGKTSRKTYPQVEEDRTAKPYVRARSRIPLADRAATVVEKNRTNTALHVGREPAVAPKHIAQAWHHPQHVGRDLLLDARVGRAKVLTKDKNRIRDAEPDGQALGDKIAAADAQAELGQARLKTNAKPNRGHDDAALPRPLPRGLAGLGRGHAEHRKRNGKGDNVAEHGQSIIVARAAGPVNRPCVAWIADPRVAGRSRAPHPGRRSRSAPNRQR